MKADPEELNQQLTQIAGELRRFADTIDRAAVGGLPPEVRPCVPRETVGQAITRLWLEGFRSQLFEMDRELLKQLCFRLADPGMPLSQTVTWLNERLDAPIDYKAVNRFAKRFRAAVEQLSTAPSDEED